MPFYFVQLRAIVIVNTRRESHIARGKTSLNEGELKSKRCKKKKVSRKKDERKSISKTGSYLALAEITDCRQRERTSSLIRTGIPLIFHGIRLFPFIRWCARETRVSRRKHSERGREKKEGRKHARLGNERFRDRLPEISSTRGSPLKVEHASHYPCLWI